MVLAVDVIDRRGPSNKMHHQLQSKKIKVRLYKPFILQQKTFYPPFITNKTKCFSFESEYVIREEYGKMRRQVQPKKTRVRLY